ncbi:hypothetical protein K5549_008385 [Capra hircus]|nr:hypothetical protein K5549_008385 [Capra hircus]
MSPPALAVLGLLLLLLPTGEATKKPTPCKRCRELVDKFNQGMVDTAKKNFGGGNTAWEEKTLSKYEFSEVRLLEIVEGLCEASDFECNQLLEEQEELLEAWWLRLKKKHPDLFEWFCVQTLKACCPPGTYGPDCLGMSFTGHGGAAGLGAERVDGGAPGGPPAPRRPLSSSGYQGPLCTDCMDGYFRAPAGGTHSICSGTGSTRRPGAGAAPVGRAAPPPGSLKAPRPLSLGSSAVLLFPDVDECAAEPPPCEDTQYCENINGSFVCEECDPTCVGCTGKGPAQCRECITGYSKESGQCEDIDECSLAEKPCLRDNENCYNTPGSFVCVCPDGFKEAEGTCVQTRPAGAEATEASPTQTPSREDL